MSNICHTQTCFAPGENATANEMQDEPSVSLSAIKYYCVGSSI